MKEFFPVLHAAPLFSGISDEELGKMRHEGLLDFHKSHFLLKVPDADSLLPSTR